MRLYLLRHGDAIESPYYHDSQRPLSDLGQRQIQSVARFLQSSRAKIDLILSSPFVRARETADCVGKSSGTDIVTSEHLLSGASDRELLKEINRHEVGALTLVGHEPQLSGLISLLTAGDQHFRVSMKKGSLACVEVKFPVKKGDGVLEWLLTQPYMELAR